MKALKKKYETACNEYLQVFCDKQEMDNGGWVADKIGTVAYCSDFFFNMEDIRIDIDTKQPVGAIIDWYYTNLDNPQKVINYYSYSKGLRIKKGVIK